MGQKKIKKTPNTDHLASTKRKRRNPVNKIVWTLIITVLFVSFITVVLLLYKGSYLKIDTNSNSSLPVIDIKKPAKPVYKIPQALETNMDTETYIAASDGLGGYVASSTATLNQFHGLLDDDVLHGGVAKCESIRPYIETAEAKLHDKQTAIQQAFGHQTELLGLHRNMLDSSVVQSRITQADIVAASLKPLADLKGDFAYTETERTKAINNYEKAALKILSTHNAEADKNTAQYHKVVLEQLNAHQKALTDLINIHLGDVSAELGALAGACESADTVDASVYAARVTDSASKLIKSAVSQGDKAQGLAQKAVTDWSAAKEKNRTMFKTDLKKQIKSLNEAFSEK